MTTTIPEFPQLRFGNLYCIGRNYSDHIREMKSEATSDPVVFLKPTSSIVRSGDTVLLPEISKEVHHEVELVLLIGESPTPITTENALEAIKAFAVGLDLTARDLQSEAKKKGLPWTLAKGFKTFAPIGNFVEFNPAQTDIQNLGLNVEVNGQIRQEGSTSQMIFSVSEIVYYLSKHFILKPGDLIFTGTPEGVSAIQENDRIKASVGNHLSQLEVYVAR